MANLNNKINFNPESKSFLENIFPGKTLSEIKNMSPQERQELISTKTVGQQSSQAPKYSKRTSFDYVKSVKPESLSNSSRPLQSAPVKPEPVPFTRDTTKKPYKVEDIGIVKRFPNPINFVSGDTNNNRQLTRQNLNMNVDNSSTEFISGTVDYSFVAGDGYGFDGSVYAIAQSSDGTIYIGGNFGTYYIYDDSYYSPYLIALNPNGTVNGDFDTNNLNGPVYSIVVQPDGKIIVGGDFTTYSYGPGYSANRIARINPDGSFDYTFAFGTGFDDIVNTIELQPDGKILVGGDFKYFNGINTSFITRLNSNGSNDSSFLIGDSSVLFNTPVYTIKIQTDNKILVGGNFNAFAGQDNWRLIRLNIDGSKDNTFHTGYGFNFDDTGDVYSIDLQSDGKIIVGGKFYVYNNNPCNNIVRLNTDGSLDNTFGFGLDDNVNIVKVQPNGKILVGGFFKSYYPYYNDGSTENIDELVRFNSDCTFDYSFYYNELFNSSPFAIDLLSDGTILIGGEFDNNGNPSTYPLNYFGKLYNSLPKYEYVYLVTSDCNGNGNGKSYSVGSNVEFGRDSDYHTISFKSIHNDVDVMCGSILTAHHSDNIYPYGIPEYEYVNTYGYDGCLDCLSDNLKYVRAYNQLSDVYDYFNVNNKYEVGDFFFINETFVGYVGGDTNTTIRGCLQIIEELPLDFSTYSNIPYVPYLTCEECVEANGVPYVAYNWDVEYVEYFISNQFLQFNSAIILPNTPTNANIVVSSPMYYNANEYKLVPEINSIPTFDSTNEYFTNVLDLMSQKGDGQLDFTFNSDFIGNSNAGFNDWVFTTKEQPDGKILVGGYFNQYNGEFVSGGICRLNSDGTIDNEFNVDLSDYYVYAIEVLSDGSILIGGDFEGAQGYESYYMIKVDQKGNLDVNFTNNLMSFIDSPGFNGQINTIKTLTDGSILVGGNFSMFNGNEVDAFVKLNSDGTVNEGFLDTKVYFNNYVKIITLQDDGKILVGGSFDGLYDNITDNLYDVGCLVRLNSDGSLDFTFNSYTPATFSTQTPFSGVTSRYIRWTITGVKDGASTSTQVSELYLTLNGQLLSYGGFKVITNPDGTNPAGEEPDYLIDDNITTKWTDTSFNLNGESVIIIDNAAQINFDGYKYYTGNDFPERDPIDWTLDISDDGTTWTTVSTVTGATITNDREASSPIFLVTPTVDFGGSIYLDNSIIDANTSTGVWNIGENDLTFEWFQKFTGNFNDLPTVFDYNTGYFQVSFNQNGELVINVNGSLGGTYTLPTPIQNTWCHIAITRQFTDPTYEWRIYQNGIYVDTFEGAFPFGQATPLIIGNKDPNNNNFNTGQFTGYITNFRVNNGMAYYTGTNNFIAPTQPLDPNLNIGGNVVLCLSVLNQFYFIADSSDDNIPTTLITTNNGFNDSVIDIKIDLNGKILVGGNFTMYNGTYYGYSLIRLNNNGTVDGDFTIGGGFNNGVNSIGILPDGNILVGGWFWEYNKDYTYVSYKIIKLDNVGNPDLKFITGLYGLGFDAPVFSIEVMSDGNSIVGGWFDIYLEGPQIGDGGGVVKLFTADNFKLTQFVTCDNNESDFLYLPKNTDGGILKGDVNNTHAVCGIVLNEISGTTLVSGSNYFSGDDNLIVNNCSDNFYPGTYDFTIEWYQKRENNGQNSRPFSIGSYDNPSVTIAVSFEDNTDFTLWLNDVNYNFGNLFDIGHWSHFAITRDKNIIRVFYNGVEVFYHGGYPILFMGNLYNSNSDNLNIGNESNPSLSGQFQGYLTNFRYVRGKAIYTSNFEVSRVPLSNHNTETKVLLLSSTEDTLLTNSGNDYYSIDQGNWDGYPTDFDLSNPFDDGYRLFNNDGITHYDDCQSCLDTVMYKSIMYVRDGGVTPNRIERHSIKPSVVTDYKNLGPIFTLRRPECYELLNYFY